MDSSDSISWVRKLACFHPPLLIEPLPTSELNCSSPLPYLVLSVGPASLPPLQISHWRGIREILESNGATVFIARVPATSSIEERAEILAKTLEERFEGKEVNLVAHSMVRPLFSHSLPSFLHLWRSSEGVIDAFELTWRVS
jgi:hypothetical protein